MLSPSIQNLTKLESVLLQNNAISGSIPAEIGKLEMLQTLNLSNNGFIGEIPSSLGSLKKLNYLYLHDIATKLAKRHMEEVNVGFLNPQQLNNYRHDVKAVEKYIAETLNIQGNKRYVIGALHIPNHWMLIVIHADESICYVLDSKQSADRDFDEISLTLQTAWRLYCIKSGITRHPSGKSALDFQWINCPQQPGSVECGYYIMKWMYEITAGHSRSKKNLKKCIEDGRSVIIFDEIDKIREVWAKFVTQNGGQIPTA